jgi:hypothetical protein
MFRRTGLAVALLAIAIIVALALYFLSRPAGLRSRARDLAPAGTLVLLQVPDFAASESRWGKTALFRLSQEPEVKTFLEQGISRLGEDGRKERWEKLSRARPREIFAALTELNNARATFVVGLQYSGNRQDVEDLWSEAKQRLQRRYSAGYWDLIRHENDEVETFAHGETTWGAAFKDDWFFAANNLELLKATLDRFAGRAENRLSDDESFKAAIKRLPHQAEAVAYIKPGNFVDRLITLAQASGQQINLEKLHELKQVEAIAASMSFDGSDIRDTIFLLNPRVKRHVALENHALAFTSPETLLYYAALAEFPSSLDLPETAADATGILQLLRSMGQSLAQHGLSPSDLPNAFGPEIGALLNWPANKSHPDAMIALDVKDPQLAGRFVTAITSAGGVTWAKQQINAVDYYMLPQPKLVWLSPLMALTNEFLVIGLDFETVQSALQRLESNAAHLDRSELYKKTAESVVKPTAAYAFIETKTLFERLYGTLRPFLVMWANFMPPDSTKNVDLSRLPSTESIAKHLSPIVYSHAIVEDGAIIESAGSITANQMFLGAGAAVGLSAGPILKQMMSAPETQPTLPLPTATPPAQNQPTPSPAPTGVPVE